MVIGDTLRISSYKGNNRQLLFAYIVQYVCASLLQLGGTTHPWPMCLVQIYSILVTLLVLSITSSWGFPTGLVLLHTDNHFGAINSKTWAHIMTGVSVTHTKYMQAHIHTCPITQTQKNSVHMWVHTKASQKHTRPIEANFVHYRP